MKKKSFFHTCFLISILGAVLVLGFTNNSVASLDNKGTDFILGFLPNYSGTGNVELHLTSEVATDVTVNYPVNSPTFTTTVAVTPGSVTIVSIPAAAQSNWNSGSIRNNCVRAYSDNEFVCYMINRQPYTSDASLAIPVDTFNNEYFTITYPGYGAEFVVFAAYDDTAVTIELNSGGSPINITLDRGEGYFYRSNSDLTGTLITSTKPLGVTSGNECVNYDGSACDHIFEMLPPVQAWDMTIPAANAPETSLGVRYGIVASVDATTVTYNGTVLGNLNRGQSLLTERLSNDIIFAANQPIMVGQYLANRKSSWGDPIGDPAIGIMTPASQYMYDYTFSTVGGAQFAENNVTIIAYEDDLGLVSLDDVTIPAADFSQIGTSEYYSTIKYIADGVHTTSSPGKHGITVEGFHLYDSYLYTGGALFQFVNPRGDANPPICECDENYNCTATDNRPSEDVNGNDILDPGEDLNGNGIIDIDKGIFFVELAPDSVNLSLTTDPSPFVPGIPSLNYSIAQIDPSQDGVGEVVVTDGAGNTCGNEISIPGEQEICGDINGDNVVDINDRNILRGALRTCNGDVSYVPEADMNEDGCINFTDYQLWYQCYTAFVE